MASPFELAMRRMWRSRTTKAGIAILVGFVLCAIYAPFLCSDIALIWIDDDGLSLPAIREMFNRNLYGKPHHLFFNLMSLLLPETW